MLRRDDGFGAELQAHEVISKLQISSLPVNPFTVADGRACRPQQELRVIQLQVALQYSW
jgi:hypothetical protein